MSGLTKNLIWFALFLILCGMAVAVRFEYVHRNSGEWGLRPSAESRLLRYQGHYYHRVGSSTTREPGFYKNGEDLGGGYFFVPATGPKQPLPGVPALIQVKNLRRYYEYRLIS